MKINLIIVDDHCMFLEGMSAALSKQENLNVWGVFDSAKEALKVLDNNVPDLLITDISMPEINGLEFVKMVNKKFPDLKILVMSMFRQIQSLDGINGYLLKETNFDELLCAIDSIVIRNENYFYKGYQKNNDVLDFNKKILSSREKDIVNLIAKELTTDEIAETLFLSKHTIETHKKNIFLKLQVNNAAGLVKKAMYLGYL
ncbi:response regulator transcription factor [Flavivirga jejuensis]|uniref:Response regulator transcription factor n=1 Tax=Flavivirga jejuensis TaxID=870487 RepID=A0ABT8WKA4_9FLAO|nr:response regulator transcription factor [Flavivirga jejuensis]MDO5973592.1 response regulator transcription factor [Flavivirga jejuensis]